MTKLIAMLVVKMQTNDFLQISTKLKKNRRKTTDRKQ